MNSIARKRVEYWIKIVEYTSKFVSAENWDPTKNDIFNINFLLNMNFTS